MTWRDRINQILDPPKGFPRLEWLMGKIEALGKAGPMYNVNMPNQVPARMLEEEEPEENKPDLQG